MSFSSKINKPMHAYFRHFKNAFLTASGLIFMGNTLLFGVPQAAQNEAIYSKHMSLENRYANKAVNDVMKDNILLTLAYMRGLVHNSSDIDWERVRKPFDYVFTLKPGETYAFQKDSLPEFEHSIVVTTDLHFASQEGFKSDGYLFGDGVCHLASLFYWAAKDANLTAVAPTNHDFAQIPEIPREYGVAIYSQPNEKNTNAHQNLYIQDNFPVSVTFEVSYDGKNLEVKIKKNVQENPTSVTEEVI